nr:unnamed protein product [Callosobruchus chinensis]
MRWLGNYLLPSSLRNLEQNSQKERLRSSLKIMYRLKRGYEEVWCSPMRFPRILLERYSGGFLEKRRKT